MRNYFLERRGRERASKIPNEFFPTEFHHTNDADVDVIWSVYVQFFRVIQPEADVPCLDLNDTIREDTWAACSDLDVGCFQHLDDNALNNLLHFPEGRPSLFAHFRSISRKCAWDEALEKDFVKDNPDMLPVALQWHQRVGVAALVHKFWEVEKHPGGVPGVLLADDVGVGKTALIMGMIAFIIHAYSVQQFARGLKETAEALPAAMDPSAMRVAPLLGESDSVHDGSQWCVPPREPCPLPPHKLMSHTEQRSFFVGQTFIPNLPHLIVVPNSMSARWLSELRTFFAPSTVEIYEYPTVEEDFASFWTGHWASSKMPVVNRIILVPHSVSAQSRRWYSMLMTATYTR